MAPQRMTHVKPYRAIGRSAIPRAILVALAAIVTAAASFAATPVISVLEIKGCSRGLALTIGADAPFDAAIHTMGAGKEKSSIVEISCSNVIYGLNEYRFKNFPAGCPIGQITANEDKNLNSVKIAIKILNPVEKKIRYKQKDNRWLLLLSSAQFNDFTWSQQSIESKDSGVSSVNPAIAANAAATYLQDISILHREQVENVIFKFSGPTEINLKSEADRITAVFVNVKNGLPGKTFKPENAGLVKSITLGQTVRDKASLLGASILINRDDNIKPLVRIFSDRLVIYGYCSTKKSIYFWSAQNGMALSYDFISPQQFPVDYQKIEKMAMSDSKKSDDNGTFSVDGKNEENAPVPHVPSMRIVVIRDNVNLRSKPSTAAAGTVIVKLPIGATGNQLGRYGLWRNVEMDGTVGWIMGRLIMDSTKITRAMWNRIEYVKAAKARRDEKAGMILPIGKENAPLELLLSQVEVDKANADVLAGSSENTSGKFMIHYEEFGRDPFLPLSQEDDGTIPGIDELKLVGILYDASDRIALFEDIRNKGKTYTLRERDMVRNGILSRIREDRIMFSLNELGISRTYWMKLDKVKDDENIKVPSAKRHVGNN